MAVILPDLPYERSALSPYLSENTINFHYGKHHATYVANLNKLIEGTALADKTLEDIIISSANSDGQAGVFNNAAQVWNHSFFWQSMKPDGGGPPTGDIAEKITADLGGYEQFVKQFKDAGLSQFGSGWVWLVINSGKLEIVKTANADTPVVHGEKPLMTVDVWEHAYYLDYQNRRGDYMDAFFSNLINWDFVNSQLG